MLVPRAYSYAAPSTRDILDEKTAIRPSRRSMASKEEKKTGFRPASVARTTTEPALRVASSPVPVRTSQHTRSAARAHAARSGGSAASEHLSRFGAHDSKAVPPAVAALLAVTQNSRPKSAQQKQTGGSRRQWIDRRAAEAASDEGFDASYSSSPGLSILLGSAEDGDDLSSFEKQSAVEDEFLSRRSTSSESVPSLDADAQSILSYGSLSTPESVRSRRSISNLRKEKPRSVPRTEECASDHPLVSTPVDDNGPDPEFILSPPETFKASKPKSYSRFTSNLTLSLQALKNAALNSISSFSGSPASPGTTSLQRASQSPFPDDVLWSHPFLFPRFSPEIRPAIQGTPSEAQRRYLNPMPLTFEEQEAPYQLALHAPFLAEPIEGAPTIQMSTYSRGKRKSGHKRGGLDPQSEAGRALLGAAGVRQREPRENSDFLRVVVLEMNMRRSGKLETGRAKIWLPPRKVAANVEPAGRVPRRWVGESAY